MEASWMIGLSSFNPHVADQIPAVPCRRVHRQTQRSPRVGWVNQCDSQGARHIRIICAACWPCRRLWGVTGSSTVTTKAGFAGILERAGLNENLNKRRK
jgi:hypothetical protein